MKITHSYFDPNNITMAQFINLEELISLSLSVKMNKNANYTEKLSIFIDEISQNMQKKIKETDW